MQLDVLDQATLGERKEAEYVEGTLQERKHTSQMNFRELERVRGINEALTEEIDEKREKTGELKKERDEADQTFKELSTKLS